MNCAHEFLEARQTKWSTEDHEKKEKNVRTHLSPKTALDAQASIDKFVARRVSRSDFFCQSTSTECFPFSCKNAHDVRKSSQSLSSIAPKRRNELGMDRLRKYQAYKNTVLARMTHSASSTEDWLERVRHAVLFQAHWTLKSRQNCHSHRYPLRSTTEKKLAPQACPYNITIPIFSLNPRNKINTPERTAPRLQNQLRIPCGPWLAFSATTENDCFCHGRIVFVLGL